MRGAPDQRVLRDLLLADYHLSQSVPIMHHGSQDAMDIYVQNR